MGMPVTTRGAGTSCAGNAVGPGLIVDTSRHLTRSTPWTPTRGPPRSSRAWSRRRCRAAAAPYGLRFGPDPSTHTRCTIGGMIGNNACGPRALGYGKTADNVVALDVVTGSGERLRLDGAEPTRRLAEPARAAAVVEGDLGTIRTEFGRFGRQVSGYSLEHLLPENRFDVARFLAGTEGTLAVIVGATRAAGRRRPAQDHDRPRLSLDGRGRRRRAGDRPARPDRGRGAGPADRRRGPPHHGRRRPCRRCPGATAGCSSSWSATTRPSCAARADALLAAAGAWTASSSTNPRAGRWRCGRSGRTAPGWPGSASPSRRTRAGRTPPSRRSSWARYLRDFDAAAAASTGCTALPYGHFGDGCVHMPDRLPAHRGRWRGRLPERSSSRPPTWSPATAARCPASTGTAGPGPHCCRRCTPPRRCRCSGRSRPSSTRRTCSTPACWSTRDRWTPTCGRWRWSAAAGETRFAAEVHRCTGVGKCLADTTAGLGVMCPSYQATREEKDSTRGRARVLQEMINGEAGPARLDGPGGARGAGSVPVLQGVRPGLPDRDRHGGVQGAGA